VVLLPRPHQYYGPLRLPLRSHPFRRYAAYRARRSQATRELAPHGSHCWGGDGSLLFPRRLCQRSTPSTPLGSSGLLLQALHPFPGLRPGPRDSAPSCLLAEGRSRRGRLRFMLRTAGLHPPERRARPRASTPRSPQTPAGCYEGDLVPPSAGLAPASRLELSGRSSPDPYEFRRFLLSLRPRWTPCTPCESARRRWLASL
jgi:hypothetical protein